MVINQKERDIILDVKKQLDNGGLSSLLDYVEDDEIDFRDGKKGYSPLEILNFCSDHKVRE